jgi:hypothetical protein
MENGTLGPYLAANNSILSSGTPRGGSRMIEARRQTDRQTDRQTADAAHAGAHSDYQSGWLMHQSGWLCEGLWVTCDGCLSVRLCISQSGACAGMFRVMATGQLVVLHPSSVLASQKPTCIVFNELVSWWP